VNITHILDQFHLFKKILLNEEQCRLLNNRDLKIITEKTLINNVINEVMLKKQFNDYIKLRIETMRLNSVDKLLFSSLPQSLKDDLVI